MISRIELCQVFTILSANNNNKCSPDISDSESHISASDDYLETNYFNSLQKSTMLSRISKKTVSAKGGNKLVLPLEAKNTPSSITRQ